MDFLREFEQWKKNYFRPYCLKKCGGKCCWMCHKHVVMSEKQTSEILRASPKQKDLEILIKFIDRDKNGEPLYGVLLYQNEERPYCPAFDYRSKKCKIQHDKPEMCVNFPFKFNGNHLRLHTECDLGHAESRALKKLTKLCQRHAISLHRLCHKLA